MSIVASVNVVTGETTLEQSIVLPEYGITISPGGVVSQPPTFVMPPIAVLDDMKTAIENDMNAPATFVLPARFPLPYLHTYLCRTKERGAIAFLVFFVATALVIITVGSGNDLRYERPNTDEWHVSQSAFMGSILLLTMLGTGLCIVVLVLRRMTGGLYWRVPRRCLTEADILETDSRL